MIYEHDNKGVLTLIEKQAIADIKLLLQEFDPKMIVELGTYRGGMVKYYLEWFPNIPIFSFDVIWQIDLQTAQLFRENNVNIIIGNLFNNNLLVPLLCSLPIKKFLFLDNGDREIEAKEFAGCLRGGDLLGMHDWPTECLPLHSLIFDNFKPHPFNKKCEDTPGFSDCRFFLRKGYRGNIRIPVEFRDKEKNDAP